MTKPTMELVHALCDQCTRDALADSEAGEADALLSEIRQRLEAMERDAARYAHIISRITQSELETVIRREHDDDGEYTTFLVQMIDAAMEADK